MLRDTKKGRYLFWVTVMLIANNISFENKFLSVAQNKANENLCLFTAHVSNNICENLCFSSDFSYESDEYYEFIGNKDKGFNYV